MWLQNECEEIESLKQKHDIFNLHKKIQHVTRGKNSRSSNSLLHKHNKLLYGNEKILGVGNILCEAFKLIGKFDTSCPIQVHFID